MKALRWHNVKDLRLDNIEEPLQKKAKLNLKLSGVEFVGVTYMNIQQDPFSFHQKTTSFKRR